MTTEAITLSPEELRDAPPKREINTADYTDRQEQILSALALLDDLGQDAYDHGQVELSARLHQAHADVERFRKLRKPAEVKVGSLVKWFVTGVMSGETETRRGIVTSITKRTGVAGVMFVGGEYPVRVSLENLVAAESI